MLDQLIDGIERLGEVSTQYTAALGLDAPVSLVDVEWLVKVSDLLTESPGPNLNWITRSDLESIVAEAKYYKELFNVYREKKSIIEDRYNHAFFELPEGITSRIKYEWSNTSKFLTPGDPLGIEILKYRKELLQFVRETKGLIQVWLREVNDIAQLMGLPIKDLTLDRIKQLAQLSLLCHSEERPDPSWLDPMRLQQTRDILPGAKIEYTKYNIQKQKLMELYDESFLNLELERLTEKFSGIYRTVFRWFLPRYYKDKRAIARTIRTGLTPPSLRADLLSARELLRLHHRLQAEFNYISSLLGQHYKGYATDFELIERCLSVATKATELAGLAEVPKGLVEAMSIGKLPPSDLRTIGSRLLISIEQWEKTAQRLTPLVRSQKLEPTGLPGFPSLLLELGQWSDEIELPLANLCNLLDEIFATCSGKTPSDFPAIIKDLESLDELRFLLGNIADESNRLRMSFGTGDFPAITKDLESLDELRVLLGNIADESNRLRKSFGASLHGINTRWNDVLAVLDWVCQLLKLFGSRPIPTQLASLASRGADAIPSNNELSKAYVLAKELVESFESSLEPPKPKQPPFEHVFLNERPAERGITSPVETERIRKFQEEAQGPPDDNLKNNLKSQEIPPQESLRKQLPFKYLSLEERLIERGIISAEERERILKLKEEGQAPLLRLLVELGFVSEENLLVQVSDFLCVPLVSLSDFPSISLPLEPFSDAVDFLKYNRIVPLKMEDKDLIVATTDPTLLSPLHAIEVLTGLRVKPVLAREKDIAARIEELFGSSTSFKSEGGHSPDREIDETVNEGDLEHLRDMASEVPVIRIVNQMISRALETRASDIHIEPFEDEVKVRYRIDGVLHEVDPPPRHFSAAIISRFKILAQLDIAERRLPQDGRIKTKIAGKDLDMRIATIPTLYGESVVVRLLERSQIFADLESLGFSQDLLVRFNEMITKPHGMVLVTGPTGSGKTTTLYAALQRINDPGKKIITIEDPVEYQLRGVNQIQVKPKIGLTFANGLRSIVRQDPDIIMVGEIRDFETAEIAVQAALTGHLVLSTLHTNDAAGAISRLLEMGVQDYLLASSLIGIVAQRLVRRLCTKCREEIPVESLKIEGFEGDIRKLTHEEWAEIFDGGKISTLWEARGCDSCSRTGYMGRVGIYELLSVTPEICQQIIQRADSGSIRNLAQTQGMRLLREDGWHKIRTGLTTLSEVLKVVRRED